MTKDNCTLWLEGNWTECCAMHDRRYENRRLTRKQADELLFRCVKRKSNRVMASMMYIGVRAFGWWWYDKATNPIIKESK